MPTYANTDALAGSGGTPYAVSMAVTSSEAHLYNQLQPSLGVVNGAVPVEYGQAMLATVKLFANGGPVTNLTYVILQTDFGDGQWVDVAWCRWEGISGAATFVLSAGVAGSNAFQQTRNSGTTVAGTGSNTMALGSRFRFVGNATTVGWNSSNPGPGTAATITATIRYKLLPLS